MLLSKTVKKSESFSQSVDEIAGYVLEKFGEQYAEKFLDDLQIFIKMLVLFPEVGKSYKNSKTIK